MQKLSLSLALSTILSASLLLSVSSAAPSGAQPIITGDGQVVSPAYGGVALEFSLIQKPDGTLTGGGTQLFLSSGGAIEFELTSFAFVGSTVCVAGPITASANVPPQFAVGRTVFYCINDNGDGGSGLPDTGAGTVGPPNLTAQQIIAIIGPPPPQVFQPLTAGNFKIH